MDSLEQKKLPNIIIDLGSNKIKFGFSSDLFPKYIIPNVTGKTKPNCFSPIKSYDNYYCGYDALFNSPSLDLSYPLLDNGGKFSSEQEYIKDYEQLFHYIFTEKLQIEEVNYNIFFNKFNIYNS